MRFLLALLAATICSAQQHYFTTTFAGSVPPITNPIAVKQYLDYPSAIAYDPHGNLYYTNTTEIWRLNPDGTDTLIAGTAPGVKGGNTGLAVDATFEAIYAMAFDQQGTLWIADGGISKITPDQKITRVLPVQNVYFTAGAFALAIDAPGNLYVVGYSSSAILKYSPVNQNWTPFAQVATNDVITAIAISGAKLYLLDTGNYYKVLQIDLQSGGTTSTAFQASTSASSPYALAPAPDGTIYVASPDTIYAGNPQSSTLQSFAGTGIAGYTGDGGPATQASINIGACLFAPSSLKVNPVNGDVAFGDCTNHVFRVINGATHVIQTVAGAPHFAGDNGPAILARFDASVQTFAPGTLASDSAGNLYFADRRNARIRKITTSGIISTIAGNGIVGNTGDGAKATQAQINPGNISVDKAGNLYFVNSAAFDSIRMVDVNGNIHTVAGGGSSPIANGAKATAVNLQAISCVAVDPSGNLFIAQSPQAFSAKSQILKVDTNGILSTFAQAGFGNIFSLAVDSSGVVYFADDTFNLIRKLDAQGNPTTIAGQSSGVFHSQPISAGPARSTFLLAPVSLTIDAAGNIYFVNSTTYGPQIAVIDASGNLTPIAGNPSSSGPNEISSGDGGDALKAGFADVIGLAVDPSGHLYALDAGVYIRELSPYNPASPPPYLLSNGVIGSGASLPAVQAVSPNGDATIYGGNFGVNHTLAPSDLVNGNVPTTLAGVCASFSGVPAAMLGVYPNQINVQVPNLPPGPVTVQVTLNCGKSNAVTTNLAGVVVQTASPEFFTFLPDPVAGNNPIAAVNALTGALLGPPGLLSGATFVPVKAGDVVEAFGTGWGLTTPAFGLGVLPGAAGQLALPFTLTFGGIAIPNIQYAGVAPCCAGLYQVNFTVPSGMPSGKQPLVITVGGIPSPPNAYIMVN